MDEFSTSKITKKSFPNRPTVKSKAARKDKLTFQETLDRVTLSKNPKSTDKDKVKRLSEIRYDLVNKYQADLKNGSYEVKSLDIAEKMVQKIRDEKSNPTF